jgi:hypothetical protein
MEELKFSAGGEAKATRDGENIKGDQVNPPTNKEELQLRRLHKESQPMEQLDRVIEELRKMMLRSAEVFRKGEINRGESTIAIGNKKKRM